MSDKPDGGPAFGHGDHVNGGDPGMSLRDYFAGQALAGIIPICENDVIVEGDTYGCHIARNAYLLADCMIAERDK